MELLVSDPVPARVEIPATGAILSVVTFPKNKSSKSKSFANPYAIAFAVSSALPPPTPSRISTFSFLAISNPSLQCSNLGLGTTPPKST